MLSVRKRLSEVGSRAAEVAGAVMAGCPAAAHPAPRVAAIPADRTAVTRRLHRRVVDALAHNLRRQGGLDRELWVGDVSLRFDVSDFLVRHLYFAGEPHEPATTRFFAS